MDPMTLAFTLAPSIFQGLAGLSQGAKADAVKLRDTEPLALKEAVALGRTATAAQLPGTGTQLDRLASSENGTLAAGARAGTSSQSVLGLLENADANRAGALQTLADRSDAYHQQANQHLEGLLGQEATVQQHDQETLDRNRAALRESSARNLYGALNGVSQVAAYNQTQPNLLSPAALGGIPADGSGLSPLGPDSVGDPYLRRSTRFGVFDPVGSFTPAGSY